MAMGRRQHRTMALRLRKMVGTLCGKDLGEGIFDEDIKDRRRFAMMKEYPRHLSPVQKGMVKRNAKFGRIQALRYGAKCAA